MKKIFLLSVLGLSFLSCDKNCDEEITKLNETYAKALRSAGNSSSAVKKVNSDYQERLAEINKRCN
jgi:hypothetical protein